MHTKKEKALLVAPRIWNSDKNYNYSIEELSLLVDTLGLEVCDTIIQNIKKINSAYFVGSGKAKQIVEQAKLLNADYLKIDDDTEIRREIDIEKYKTHHDPFKNNYNSVFNFILACYSRYQIVEMIKESEKEYDYIMYVRPDCYYPNPLNVDFLEKVNDKEIVVPNFHLTKEHNVRNGFNDRFAICNKNTYEVYGNVYLDLHKISKKRPLHSERVLLLSLIHI